MTGRTIGILGGMGPEATVDLMMKIIKSTPAEKDQDHIRCVVDSNPKIPDRTKYIYGGGEDPRPYLVEGARNLERVGASFIAIACNTAHYFYDDIQSSVKIPVVNIMRCVAQHLRGKVEAVGLLASSPTAREGLYQRVLSEMGIATVAPQEQGQDQVMSAIYLIKAGRMKEARDILLREGAGLVGRGVGAVIAGCTEVPLVLGPNDLAVDVLDANLILAKCCVDLALGNDTLNII